MSDFLRIVDADGDHIDVNHAGRQERRLLMFTTVDKSFRRWVRELDRLGYEVAWRTCDAASVALDEEKVRELVAFAQAWLDAPRDAARTAAEVVHRDDAAEGGGRR